jgi:hypothetical protein
MVLIKDYFEQEGDPKDWTNPLNMMRIAKAVANEDTTVVLNGRTYMIRYNESDRVFIKCLGSYAPCGWFSKAKLARYEPEGDLD